MSWFFGIVKFAFLFLKITMILSSSSSIEFPITFHHYKLSSNDSDPLTIMGSIPFCIGTPFQCFNIMVDSMNSNSWINDHQHKEYFNNSYISSFSSSKEDVNLTFSLLFAGAYCTGNYIKEIVSPFDKIKVSSNEINKMAFVLINASEIKDKVITRDGTIGLTKSYMFDSKSNTSFNYLDYLKDNGLITERIASFEYNDLFKGRIIFGIPPRSIKNKCGQDVKLYSNSWACFVQDFSLGKEKIETPNEIVMFDTILDNIFAPYEGGFFILNKFLKESKGHCYIEAESDESIFAFRCDANVNILAFEDIKFNFGKAKFTIYSQDLFTLVPTNAEYICLLKVKRNERIVWTFGLPAFKYKLISLNQDEKNIGFKDYRLTTQKQWLNIVIIATIIIVLVMFALIYVRRKSLLSHPLKEIDFTLVG